MHMGASSRSICPADLAILLLHVISATDAAILVVRARWPTYTLSKGGEELLGPAHAHTTVGSCKSEHYKVAIPRIKGRMHATY